MAIPGTNFLVLSLTADELYRFNQVIILLELQANRDGFVTIQCDALRDMLAPVRKLNQSVKLLDEMLSWQSEFIYGSGDTLPYGELRNKDCL